MDIDVTKLSSKGQIVIPADMREDMETGEKIFLIKNDDQIILKRAKDLGDSLSQDLEFAKRTEDALKRYDQGLFEKKSKDEFLGDLDNW